MTGPRREEARRGNEFSHFPRPRPRPTRRADRPDRDALAALLATAARAVDSGGTLPSCVHAAAEHALATLGGAR